MHRLVRAFPSFVVACLLLASVDATAATDPHQPALSQHPVEPPGDGVPLQCGTYKGNEIENRAKAARFKAERRRLATLRTGPVTPPMSFIHDDVWVVEDDGSLILQGNNAFDMNGTTIQFVPNGTAYDVSTVALNWDATFGGTLAATDDGAVNQALGHAFSFYGTVWNDIWVNMNGAISFGGLLNTSGFFSETDFFNATPKIAPYYMDLNPAAAGSVHFKTDASKTTVTWSGVPEFNQAVPNTFQIVMYATGVITLTYNTIGTTSQNSGLPIAVGVHPGGDPELDLIDYSADLPFAGGNNRGIYEEFVVLANPRVKEVAMVQAFYDAGFPDEFFQIIFFTNWVQTMAGFANEFNIKNDAQGIGQDIFDNSAAWGSNGILESRCNMNRLAVWNTDPTQRFNSQQNFLTIMGQESGHRWGAFINYWDSFSASVSNLILGRSNAHWSYFADVDHSSLEGGDYDRIGGNLWIVPTMIDYFCDVDEYTFGIRTAEEVTDMFYIASATNNQTANRSLAPPRLGTGVSGDSVNVSIDDIIMAEGPRVPVERPDKDLRQAFILLVKNGNTPTAGELAKIAGFRRAWEDYFEVAVDGRFAINTSITNDFQVGVIEGQVVDQSTSMPISGEFTATSIERGFVQHVPGGARYTFRYREDELSGAAEAATIAFEAPGCLADTLTVDIPYDSIVHLDFALQPDGGTPVFFGNVVATARENAVVIEWEFRADEAVDRFTLFRREGSTAPVSIASGDAGTTRSFLDKSVEPGVAYVYEVVIRTARGDEFRSPPVRATVGPLQVSLAQNFPNPFNPRTAIAYTVNVKTPVSIAIYSASGSLVARLDQGERNPGTHSAEWDGRDMTGRPVASGVYFYRLEGVRGAPTRKMVLLK
jgi:hypothetical protein